MLLELRAENYAVIDQAVASFGPGLNLLTGETGAGKSILIDALALLLGGKASADVVRHGAEKAVLVCVFEGTQGAAAILEANGIDAGAFSDDILLRREIAAGGKGRVFVNNQPATVAVLRELAPELGLIHTQGETLGSFDQAQQRGLLDRFGGIAGDDVAAAFAAWRTTTERLAELQASEQDRMRMADLWRFQTREIADAQLVAEDEDAQLEAEKLVLANSEKLYTAAKSAHELLYEQEGSAETTLTAALKHVEELAKFDARFAEPAQQLAAAKAAVEDVSAEVRDFAEKVHASPERLEEIEDRLAALDRLKRGGRESDAGGGDALWRGGGAAAGRGGESRCAVGGVAGSAGAGCGGLSRGGDEVDGGSDGGGEAAGEAGDGRDQRSGDDGAIQGAGGWFWRDGGRGVGELDGAWVEPGGVPDCDQCGRATEAAG
jgi:DNA repair protein RecN (Recombination protein N)